MEMISQQVEQIEKQIAPEEQPHIISQEVEGAEGNKTILKNLLASMGIVIVGGSAVLVILFVPFTKKKTVTLIPQETTTTATATIQLSSGPSITVETEYTNPFDTKSQYENPFIASKNPFSTITQ